MALRATIYKATLQVSDLNRNYFAEHSLTLALHPSETEERLMIRLLGFALIASQDTVFGKGLSNEEDAAVWDVDPAGTIVHWLDVGQPDETRIKKACGRAQAVTVITYGRASEVWWKNNQAALNQQDKLEVIAIDAETSKQLANLAARQLTISITVQEDVVYVNDVEVKLERLKLNQVN